MVSGLAQTQTQELENFLAEIFGEDYREMAREHIATMFSDNLSRQIFFVAVQDNQIIASIAISEAIFTTDTWGIGWVAVHPNYRHKGIATNMIKKALDEIASRVSKNSTVILSVYPDIAPLYEKIGFKGTTVDHEGPPYLSIPIYPKP